MMLWLECFLLILLVGLGAISTYTDLKSGIIPNRYIAVFSVVGGIVDAIYYIFFAGDTAGLFLANAGSVIILSLILFYTHSLAGGDCKLLAALALVYPAGMYVMYGDKTVTLFLTVAFAILYGYVFFLGMSIWKLITGDNQPERGVIKGYLVNYLKSYVIAFIYVTCVNLLFGLIDSRVMRVSSQIVVVVCMVVAWLSNRIQVLRKIPIIIGLTCMAVVLSVYLRVLPISLNPTTYLITAVLVLCQMAIRTNLYETIQTSRVKKGMILSVYSSMIMQHSRVKGLPGLSTEDLKSRLTEDEAESIKRWGKTEKGLSEIAVVRRIPFAVFIFLGYITYFVIWRITG